MGVPRFRPAALVPVSGALQVILANSTAAAVNSTCRACSALLISVETQPVRMRSDGTAPTKTTGVMFPAALAPFWFDAFNGTSQMKFVKGTSVAGTPKVTIEGFNRPSESGAGR